MIKDTKTYRIIYINERVIASLIGSLMRIKLLGRRRQWFLEKGEDCLSERSRLASPTTGCTRFETLQVNLSFARWHGRSATPKHHQLRMPLRKRPCAELFASFCRHKKKRTLCVIIN